MNSNASKLNCIKHTTIQTRALTQTKTITQLYSELQYKDRVMRNTSTY